MLTGNSIIEGSRDSVDSLRFLIFFDFWLWFTKLIILFHCVSLSFKLSNCLATDILGYRFASKLGAFNNRFIWHVCFLHGCCIHFFFKNSAPSTTCWREARLVVLGMTLEWWTSLVDLCQWRRGWYQSSRLMQWCWPVSLICVCSWCNISML